VSEVWKERRGDPGFFQLLKANHNKDYSVVKTFKAAQVAFFLHFAKIWAIAGSAVIFQSKSPGLLHSAIVSLH